MSALERSNHQCQCHGHDHDHDHDHEGIPQIPYRPSVVVPGRVGEAIASRIESLCSPEAEAKRREIAIRRLESEIRRAIGDGSTYPELIAKVANAVVDGLVSRSDHERVLSIVACKRAAGQLRRPGAYWCKCCKELFVKGGVTW